MKALGYKNGQLAKATVGGDFAIGTKAFYPGQVKGIAAKIGTDTAGAEFFQLDALRAFPKAGVKSKAFFFYFQLSGGGVAVAAKAVKLDLILFGSAAHICQQAQAEQNYHSREENAFRGLEFK